MSYEFYGKVQEVQRSSERVIVRCVREFHYDDGLMSDDVFVLDLEQPEEGSAAALQAISGKKVSGFEVSEDNANKLLRFWSEEHREPTSVICKNIEVKTGPRGPQELQEVIQQLSQEIRQRWHSYSAISRKIEDVEQVVAHKLDNARRRAEFLSKTEPRKTASLAREIEALETILHRLQARV